MTWLLRILKGFAGLVAAAAAWSIWGSDMFPAEQDPSGGTLIQASCEILSIDSDIQQILINGPRQSCAVGYRRYDYSFSRSSH